MSDKPTSKPHVIIVLPTYNEVENIQPLFSKFKKVIAEEKNYQFSVLVVDDNSPDGTAKLVKELAQKDKRIQLMTGEKQGLGAAYIRGMHYAVDTMHADILFEIDADLSHDPTLISAFLRKIEEGADFVIGSRYIKGGSIPHNWAIERKVFSVIGNLIVRFGLMIPHIHEWSNGYRALRSEVFTKISEGLDRYKGYIFQIASLHRAVQDDFVIAEIPCEFSDRKYGTSKIIPLEYIVNIFKYIALNSSFVRFGFVGLIGFTINVIGLEVFYRIGFDPGVASAMGGEFSIMSNFTLNNYWTFSHKKIQSKSNFFKKFLHFNTVALGAVIIQAVIVGIGTHMFGDHTRLLFLVLAVVVFIVPYSYFMYNRFIWKHEARR